MMAIVLVKSDRSLCSETATVEDGAFMAIKDSRGREYAPKAGDCRLSLQPKEKALSIFNRSAPAKDSADF
jgi:hypothetical protein